MQDVRRSVLKMDQAGYIKIMQLAIDRLKS